MLASVDWLRPDLSGLTAGAVYAIVFALMFVESGLLVGFLLPGDTVLFTAGLLAADPDHGLSVPLLALGVAVCAVAGNALGYESGRRLGRPWLQRRGGRFGHSLERAEQFYARWGWSALVAARFVPWLRTFTPILAGCARMSYVSFLTANLVGALLWGSGLVLLGYAAHGTPWLRHAAYVVAVAAIAASVVGTVLLHRRRRERPDPT